MHPISSSSRHLACGCSLLSHSESSTCCWVVLYGAACCWCSSHCATWVSHRLAHAGSLQWPTLLGTETTISNLCRVPAHPGQPPTPYGSHSKAVGLLCSLSIGSSWSLAGILSPLLPGYPCHATRVWDAILATELPLDNPLHIAPVYWQQFVLH